MLGIIDVREWQEIVDLATARPANRKAGFLKPLQDLAKKFPYPGDLGNAGTDWVLSAARETVSHYNPGWLFLSFTQPFFNGVYRPYTITERKSGAKYILDQIMDFAYRHDFSPIIISSGGLVPLQGYITIPTLKGNLQASAWSYNMAGIYKSEPGDEKLPAQEPLIETIIYKKEFLNRYKDIINPVYKDHFPDYLLIAKDGWSFRGIGSNNRPLYNIEKYNHTLPVYSEIGTADHVEEICGLMEKALKHKKKVLLALIEGLDEDDFFLPYEHINNCRDWYAYSSYNLYYTLVTGKPFYRYTLPPIYDLSIRRTLPLRYPMSIPNIKEACTDSLGHKANVPTAAVSSRSMITHPIINADLMIECYIRAQANMGVLVAVNEDRYG